MGSFDRPLFNPPDIPGSRWGETFLSRFDLKFRSAGKIIHPLGGDEFRVDPKATAQSFIRNFGEVLQFVLVSGLLKRTRFHLDAISLHDGGLTGSGSDLRPAEDILRRIAGADGLDFQDDAFYCVGVFSPVGWPDIWRVQPEIRGNAMYYLVDKQEGTRWQLSGPESALRDLFDPEDEGEKRTRAQEALTALSRLAVPGNQIVMDSFLETQCLDRKSVEAVIGASEGRFQTIKHRGKTYIQRSIR